MFKFNGKKSTVLCFLLVFIIVLISQGLIVGYASNSAHGERYTDDFSSKNYSLWKWNNGWAINFNHSWTKEIVYCNGYPFKNGYLELKHDFKTFDHYIISVDLVHGGSLDGDVIDGGVYFDKQGWNNAEYFYFKDLPINKAPYHIEVEAIRNKNDDRFDIECVLKDKNDLVVETKTIEDYDLKWFGLYGPEGYWDGLRRVIRVSAFDNFMINALGGLESDFQPYDFDVVQEGDKIKFSWNMGNKNSNNKFHIYYSDDEDVNTNDTRIVTNEKVDLVDGRYIYSINYDDYYNNKYFGVSYRFNRYSESEIAFDSNPLILLEKPKNFQYVDYGNGEVEFRWDEVKNAEYYVLYSNDEVIEEAQTSENSIVLSDITNVKNISVRAFSIDGGYSVAATNPKEIEIDFITNFKVIQDRDIYRISWNEFEGTEEYKIYSGLNPDEMIEVYSTNNDFTFEYEISNADYGNTRYFMVEAFIQNRRHAVSPIKSIIPIAAPEISFPDTSNVNLGDELKYIVYGSSTNGAESLIIELNEYLELAKVYAEKDSNQEISFDKSNNVYSINISDLEEKEDIGLIVKALPNTDEEIITTNFSAYLTYTNENGLNTSGITTVPDIVIQPTIFTPIVELGTIVIDEDGEMVIIPNEDEVVDINYGKEIGIKTILDVNNQDIYNPVLKYEFDDTILFKFKFPEPIIKDSDGNLIEYEAAYLRDNNKLILYVVPILKDNSQINGKYEVEFDIIIESRYGELIKDLMNNLNEPIWKLPYEIRSILNNPENLNYLRTIVREYDTENYNSIKDLTNEELEEALVNFRLKMQLLWDHEPLMNNGYERQFKLSKDRVIKFELKDMKRPPESF